MIARELLAKELHRRAIDVTSAPVNLSEGVEEPAEGPDEMDLLWKYASLAPEECTFLFKTDREAYAASALLLEAGVPSVVLGDREAIKTDLRTVRAVVKPGDAERAAEILRAPLPERLLQVVDTDPGDFVEPVCPACGATTLFCNRMSRSISGFVRSAGKPGRIRCRKQTRKLKARKRFDKSEMDSTELRCSLA